MIASITYLSNINTVNLDISLRWINISEKRKRQRRLARAGATHNADLFMSSNRERNIADDGLEIVSVSNDQVLNFNGR